MRSDRWCVSIELDEMEGNHGLIYQTLFQMKPLGDPALNRSLLTVKARKKWMLLLPAVVWW